MDTQLLIITGNATKDAEMHEAKSGKSFVRYGVASNRYLGKEKGSEPTFYECLLFGSPKQLEKAVQKIKKGSRMVSHGRPEADAYMSTKENEPKAQMTMFVDFWEVTK